MAIQSYEDYLRAQPAETPAETGNSMQSVYDALRTLEIPDEEEQPVEETDTEHTALRESLSKAIYSGTPPDKLLISLVSQICGENSRETETVEQSIAELWTSQGQAVALSTLNQQRKVLARTRTQLQKQLDTIDALTLTVEQEQKALEQDIETDTAILNALNLIRNLRSLSPAEILRELRSTAARNNTYELYAVYGAIQLSYRQIVAKLDLPQQEELNRYLKKCKEEMIKQEQRNYQ